jgi:hypothetical protein
MLILAHRENVRKSPLQAGSSPTRGAR